MSSVATAEYSGYCGIGTSTASSGLPISRFMIILTPALAPSVKYTSSALTRAAGPPTGAPAASVSPHVPGAGSPSRAAIKSATSRRTSGTPCESVYAPTDGTAAEYLRARGERERSRRRSLA